MDGFCAATENGKKKKAHKFLGVSSVEKILKFEKQPLPNTVDIRYLALLKGNMNLFEIVKFEITGSQSAIS